MAACPSDEVLLAYMEHALQPEERLGIDEHLSACGGCRRVIATVAGTMPDGSGAFALAPGERIDRYVLGDRLGAGGAGVVYAARDPELQRDVAIKLVEPLLGLDGDGRLRERLRREAQAMARLRHPNVVAVFDVGEWQDRLFIAMELVAGTTLQGWLDERRQSWREVVATFRAAGAGLAAAHAAGIIHRDFKPANVLVGDEGRVCVSDFGLAAAEPAQSSASPAEGSAVPAALTRTGALVGTPRYMAPEQFRGGKLDERTDIFAFSVALFEALHGVHPFAGENVRALALAVCAGEVREPRDGPPVPAWLERVVARGLRPRPEDRYPSMRAMLAELDRDPGRTARRIALSLGAVGVALAAVALARPSRALPCTGGPEELDRAFGPARRAALRAGMLASGAPDAAALAERTLGAIDAYGARFTAAHREACVATRVRGVQSEELLDVRMECLAQQLRGLTAVADLLAQADAATAAHALDAVLGFDRLYECTEPAALIGPLRPPPEVRNHADTATARLFLGQAQALAILARPPEGIAAANAGLVAARRQRYGTLQAELLLARGDCEELDGRYADARQTYSEAFWNAEEAHDDAAALHAANDLSYVAAEDLSDLPAADAWARTAWSKLVRLGMPPGLEMKVRETLGNLASLRHQPAQSEIELRRALALVERLSGKGSWDASAVLSGIGLALGRLRRTEEAIAAFRESIAIRERLFGHDHVSITNPLQNMGYMLNNGRRHAEALPLLERALELRRRALGARHPDTLRTQENHAIALAGVGRVDEAVAEERFVVSGRDAALGPRNNFTVGSRMYLARFLAKRGDVAEAVELYREAFEQAQGSPVAHVVARKLSTLLLERGRLVEGLLWVGRSVEPSPPPS